MMKRKISMNIPSVSGMVQELGWFALESRRQILRLVNFHRVVNGQKGWSSVPGVTKGVYLGRGHSLKVARVGSRRDVDWMHINISSPLQIERIGIGTLSHRNWYEIEKSEHIMSAINSYCTQRFMIISCQ
jgi:hypothetical protein